MSSRIPPTKPPKPPKPRPSQPDNAVRIIAGAWRGRRLTVPVGQATRPTADRVRQALFDRLLHAPWARTAAGQDAVTGAVVLDAFAGTGALGLEALSRGAAEAVFLERDRAALAALRANLAACAAQDTIAARIVAGDALRPPPGQVCSLVLLDPPYGQGLLPRAVAALAQAGWFAPDALLVAELGAAEALDVDKLSSWTHGAAQMVAWRAVR